MDEKPVAHFLEFNKDNIFENLLQAEDHLKRMKNDERFQDQNQIEALDHIQCVIKHITFAKGESSEAQAHTLNIEPEKYEKYLELQERLKTIKTEISDKATTIEKLILDVRDARGFFEEFNPDYDISKCQACGKVEEVLQPKAKTEITTEQYCQTTSNPEKCMQLMHVLEHGPATKEEKIELGTLLKDVRVTASLLESVGRLANAIP